MKKSIFIIFTFLSIINLFGSDFKKTGTAGFVFLEVPVSARTAALGESSVSLVDMNSASVFVNPGALGFTGSVHSFSASYAPWFAEINQFAASYSYKSDIGVIALSSVLFDYGTMERTVKLSGQRIYEQIGTFDANSMAIGLSYSKQLTDRFSFGVTAKYVKEQLDVYSASNVVIDGGFLYYTGLGSLRVAGVIQNFGSDAKFKNSEFKMPAVLRLGLASEVYQTDQSRVTLLVEAVHPTDSDEKLNVGAEVELMKSVTLRGGYKFFYDEEKYSFGIGLKPPVEYPVSIDFAYANYGVLGNILRFTLEIGML